MRADDNIIQQGGQVQRNESDSPRLLQSVLQNTASTYQKQFNREDRNDLLNRFKNHLEELKDIVVGKLLENQNVKGYIIFALDFHKANNPTILTEPHVTFRTEVFASFNTDNIDAMYSAAYHTLQKKISNYQSNSSGWFVDHFIDVSFDKLDI